MIIVAGRNLTIPPDEILLGYDGDNLIEKREFEISDGSLFDFNFKLDIKNNGYIGIVDLSKTVEADKIILTWDIQEQDIPSRGLLHAQLRAFDDTTLIWHSNTGRFTVGDSINATDYFPSPLPSEFEQMEQRVTQAKNETVVAKDIVVVTAVDVGNNAQTAITKASEALASAVQALQSSVNAKQSEDNALGSKNSALSSMNTAVQAMSDLLAMLGSDIATLTGGKLTPSQIPAIAITDTFVTYNTDAMLVLPAQRGDICIRTDENKTYVLSTDDPTVFDNWLDLKTPTNYADEAGHAYTAEEAVNSTMINGHRVVTMTQAQYDAAVKDAETVYMVGV